jgi:glycosyltransferase involved in cell wall biosynthesis
MTGATGVAAPGPRDDAGRPDERTVDQGEVGEGACRRLRILHFAFEDHRQPASGGGGTRTFEINRRLAARHDITVLVCNYPGAARRVEEGVEYRHLGSRATWLGRTGRMLSYHLLVPLFALTHGADLVVEDFAAPMSSIALPLFTRSPTIAVVQWLFARHLSRKYKVPFFLAEELGVRVHRRFVTVSCYMAGEILRRNPTARVRTIYAGVSPALLAATPRGERSRELLYLGRLQFAEKGLDLLIEAFSLLAARDDHVRLTLAGDGEDMGRLRVEARRFGVADRLAFAGRVGGEAKRELLQRASAVVIPSRFESFGIVAAEALASGTPVVAFDLPSLREIVGEECGLLVPRFDAGAFAAACEAVLHDPARAAQMGAAGRRRATRFDWDVAAAAQEVAYLDAAGSRRQGRRGATASPDVRRTSR